MWYVKYKTKGQVVGQWKGFKEAKEGWTVARVRQEFHRLNLHVTILRVYYKTTGEQSDEGAIERRNDNEVDPIGGQSNRTPKTSVHKKERGQCSEVGERMQELDSRRNGCGDYQQRVEPSIL